MCLLKYFKYKPVYEGHSELSNLGIILKDAQPTESEKDIYNQLDICFTLCFDELNMTNPAIQNNFSYYRRILTRMRINDVPAEGENEVNNKLAN